MMLALHAATRCLAFSACCVLFVWCVCVLAVSVLPTAPLRRLQHLPRSYVTGCDTHARSNTVPCIERVLCLLCLVCLCYRSQCVACGAAAAPATPAATLGTHALVPLHLLEHAAGCVR